MNKTLMEFWAVTTTSIYKVVARGENLQPSIRKIALRGKSRIGVGSVYSGPMLAVARYLQLFIPESHSMVALTTSLERRFENVPYSYKAEKTSPIVALFLTEEQARECFVTGSDTPCDPQWLEQTKEVIELIGHEHPTITVCRYSGLGLSIWD